MSETHVPSLRQIRFTPLSSPRIRPWATRLLATLGIVVTTIGRAVPVAGRDVFLNGGQLRTTDLWTIGDSVRALLLSPLGPLGAGRLSLLSQLGIEAVFSVLMLGGLALIPFLWQSLSQKGTVLVRRAYAAWLVLLILLTVAGLPAWRQFMSQPPQGPSDVQITLAAAYLLPGVVVFPLGVLLSGAGLGLLIREPPPRVAEAPAPRTGWQRMAALALTAGVLVWGIGFYLMPEAVTTPCPPVIFSVTQFTHGACAGLDSDQVRQAAYYAGLNPIALRFYSLSWHYQLLVAAAGITALGGWTRRLSAQSLAWLAVWPALALGVALVACYGAILVARHGVQLTAATTSWRVGPGMVVTFMGIGLVVMGQLGLWHEWHRERTRRGGSALPRV